ncbi:hypothetical protein AB0C90_02505 [Streptomyces sp. NPDC048550]|uniref:hypothetical protein n=1 Tax=unclassified Streptomyces TaxID=2593676 RepID=UPI00342F582E
MFRRPVGTVKVALVFVDFPDAPATEAPSEDSAQITPGADWLWFASYGRTWLSIDQHQRWVRMPRPSTDYGFARGLTHETHEAYVKDAVVAADRYVDFSGYDMVYVVPTRNAAAISFTPTYVYEPGTSGVVADGSSAGPGTARSCAGRRRAATPCTSLRSSTAAVPRWR